MQQLQSELNSKAKALKTAEASAANANKLQSDLSAKQNELAQLKQEKTQLERKLQQVSEAAVLCTWATCLPDNQQGRQ